MYECVRMYANVFERMGVCERAHMCVYYSYCSLVDSGHAV
jgi:hypothetical protein